MAKKNKEKQARRRRVQNCACIIVNNFMFWHKLKKNHYYNQPVEHVYSSSIFDTKEYDVLYENQNNLSHKVWKEFDEKHKTGFEFHNDLTDINFQKEVICLWFFRERNDTGGGESIDILNKKIMYSANTFLITESKDIKIINRKKEYICRPVLQLDMSKRKYKEIIERIK
jgi:hypothetical protein